MRDQKCGCFALGLRLQRTHTALSVPQAREVVRRWSPEYRFEPPQASKTLKTSALHDFVGVCTSLAALERGERGQCVLQHTHLQGLTLFVFNETAASGGSAQVRRASAPTPSRPGRVSTRCDGHVTAQARVRLAQAPEVAPARGAQWGAR